jgi:LCP family protein required for cell wall assembly
VRRGPEGDDETAVFPAYGRGGPLRDDTPTEVFSPIRPGTTSPGSAAPRRTPPGEPGHRRRPPARRKRSRTRRVLIGLTAVLLVFAAAAGGGWWYVNQQIADIPRFDVQPSERPLDLPLPADGAAQSYVVVSVGSQGMTQAEGRRVGVNPEYRQGDGLTDIIMNVLVDPSTHKASFLSVPRDTWVPSCGCKINSLLRTKGPKALTDEITRRTGVPVNHLMSVNFSAFADLTDAIGGVSLYSDRPLRDGHSKLEIPAGCVHFDGVTALKYVRSRYTEQLVDGRWIDDPSATDFGRIKRQQEFLNAVAQKVLTPSLVWKAPTYLKVARQNLQFDENLSASNLIALAQAFQGSGGKGLEMLSMPSTFGWVGDQSVVFTDEAAAPAVLARWRVAGGIGTSEDERIAPSPSATASAGTPTTRKPSSPGTAQSPSAAAAAGKVDGQPC